MLAIVKYPGNRAVECQIAGSRAGIAALIGGTSPMRRIEARIGVDGGEYRFAMFIREDQKHQRMGNILYKGKILGGPIVAVGMDPEGKTRDLSGPAAEAIRARLDELDAVHGPQANLARAMRRKEGEAV